MTGTVELTGDRVNAAARLLRRRFEGDVHRPGDPEYDVRRLTWNRRLDPHPAVVAEAAGSADVQAAIRTARELGAPFAVRSTGHGTYHSADGGVLLSTGRMATVEIDPSRRTAWVGPGATWSGVIAAAAPYGLAPLSGTPSVGVAGYTLGGGTGWLSRRHGYAADALLRAHIVTGDGKLRVASPAQNPDLHWAIRGGSGNFGVVTALQVRLFEVGPVSAGMILYAADQAPGLLTRYAEWARDEPDELNTSVILLRMPDAPQVPEPVRGRRVVALRVFCAGPAEAARRLLAPVLGDAGAPLLHGLQQSTFAEAATNFGGPPPAPTAVWQHFDLVRDVPAGMVDTLIAAVDDRAGAALTAVELRHWAARWRARNPTALRSATATFPSPFLPPRCRTA
jgi:FAD/FMN-containing dehydrogenase